MFLRLYSKFGRHFIEFIKFLDVEKFELFLDIFSLVPPDPGALKI